MGFQSFAAIGRNAAVNMHWQYVYKPTTPATGVVGYFVDLNQSSGIPKYNPFAGSALTATPLVGAGNLGVFPGVFETGKTKHLISWQVLQNTATNGPPDYCHLLDYLNFYPLIDTDDPDPQTMDNTLLLPRYSYGRIVLIVTAPLAVTAPITITYKNENGVSGRTATANLIPGTAIGICATGMGTAGGAGQATPYFPLDSGDVGVSAIESVQMSGAAGGFICAAIVKPLATLPVYEAGVPCEIQFPVLAERPPEIIEGACLNFIIQRGGTAAGAYQMQLQFVNS
jgi:hypothetical protein